MKRCTVRGVNANLVAFLIAGLMVFSWPAAGTGADRAPACAEPRAVDLEPNDNYTYASSISKDDSVEGSLLMDPPADTIDYYRLDVPVPFGKVLCATLAMIDYDPSCSWKYHFTIHIDDINDTIGASAFSDEATKSARLYQMKTADPMTLYINVERNSTSQPGRYRLNVTLYDVPTLSGSPVSGYLHNITGPTDAWYIVETPPADGKGMTVTLDCPSTGNFGLEVFMIWSFDHQRYQLNQSNGNANGGARTASVVGYNGTYFIHAFSYMLYWWGYGPYTLRVAPGPGPEDENEFFSQAVLLESNEPQGPFSVVQGVDWIDWYRVHLKTGKTLPSAYFSLIDRTKNTDFNFSAYDKDLNLINSKRTTGTYGIDFKDITVGYDGPVYFAVRVDGEGYDSQTHLILPGRGSYKMTMTFNNIPPRLTDELPQISMAEDSTDSSLLLSEHFEDPDGDNINFTLIGSGYHTRPVVDRGTGRVTFTPEPNWSGEEKVRFTAKDDGPGEKSVECNTTVTVLPVNDPPYALATIEDVTIAEGKVWQSPAAASLFADIDDPLDNLGFACKVVDSTAHPPGSQLPVKFDSQNRYFVAGPARLFFGDFTIEINCTDRKAGTVPAVIRFNISITHVNHDPARNSSLTDPLKISMLEGEVDHQVNLDGLFTDQDLPADYAADVLTFTFTGAQKLDAIIQGGNILVLGAGKEELQPGYPLGETLMVTAKDAAGRTASVNLTVTVMPVNDPPVIQAFQPVNDAVTANEGTVLSFSATVVDPDTEASLITYSWYLDGTKDTKSKGATFAYAPSFNTGDSAHVVRVEVSDGEFNASMQWNITVKNVNRAPSGSITAPSNFTKYKKGPMVSLTAAGSDPDGDNLTYIWRDERGVELGKGAIFATDKLPTGTQKIKLEVSDGTLTASQEVTVIVTAPAAPAKSPGFETAVFVAVLGVCLLLGKFKGRGRKQGCLLI
jgi:hypothetical protein